LSADMNKGERGVAVRCLRRKRKGVKNQKGKNKTTGGRKTTRMEAKMKEMLSAGGAKGEEKMRISVHRGVGIGGEGKERVTILDLFFG